jgi:hypothetical protein
MAAGTPQIAFSATRVSAGGGACLPVSQTDQSRYGSFGILWPSNGT